MSKIKALAIALALVMALPIMAQRKREFRGAWIQCVNGQFMGLSTSAMQQTLSRQLDVLKADGINAIFFQVRAECDALYASPYEPWSRFLTGVQGKAPQPYWDPLEWMVDECHKRGMELHAWINPYRAKTKNTTELAQTHIAVQHPERSFNYDGQKILNPGLPENRDYICQIAADIIGRYDVDGLHIDDYFYPYPAAGQTINDDLTYQTYPNGIADRGDWRRNNVNLFIQQLYQTVRQTKPWVKFGVSPFGIYRNKRSAEMGSATNGLQNYDDLYADVLLWVNNGWVDYIAPQLYWQIGHKAADYKTLIEWWDKHCRARHLYIGEDVERTVGHADLQNPAINQMPAKFAMRSRLPHVQGAVLWYAKAVVDDVGNYGSMLRNVYWKYPALQPLMHYIDGKAPKKPRKVKPVWTSDGYMLFWTAPKANKWNDVAHKYVVYRFSRGEKVDLNDPTKIVAITSDNFITLPYEYGLTKYTYCVTALDRLQNESKPVKVKVKL